MESCPSDSTYVGGICKCNPEYCSKPPCLTTLKIEKFGIDKPGNCCTTYTCDGCTENDRINGKCPCAPNATLNNENRCECIDPYRTLSDKNVCECDERKCNLPQICDKGSVPTKILDGCCYKTKCITCPPDSYPTTNYSDEVEDKCICFKCKEMECNDNETVVIQKRATGTPGMCCDLYTCERIQNPTCLIGNISYPEGDSWETAEEMCKCYKGIALCSKSNRSLPEQSCFDDGKIYHDNETWIMDACTNCTCLNGTKKCISHLCQLNVNHIGTFDCPPLDDCSKNCPNGFTTDKQGCKMCKCSKDQQLEDILYEYNISKSELESIITNWKNGYQSGTYLFLIFTAKFTNRTA